MLARCWPGVGFAFIGAILHPAVASAGMNGWSVIGLMLTLTGSLFALAFNTGLAVLLFVGFVCAFHGAMKNDEP
jgi:hypothetical protein